MVFLQYVSYHAHITFNDLAVCRRDGGGVTDKPVTTVLDCGPTFVRLTPLDIHKETSGHLCPKHDVLFTVQKRHLSAVTRKASFSELTSNEIQKPESKKASNTSQMEGRKAQGTKLRTNQKTTSNKSGMHKDRGTCTGAQETGSNTN